MLLGITALVIIIVIVIVLTNYSRGNIPRKYTILITDSFSENDFEYMRPIFALIFIQNGTQEEAVLCHVFDNKGEVTLAEGKEIMIRNIQSAFENHSFVKTMVYGENLLTDGEKNVIDALNKLA